MCKKLRLHGIDTKTIENFESTDRLGEIAQEEKRMILTRGAKSYVKLKKFVPPGFTLNIQEDLLDDQVGTEYTLQNWVGGNLNRLTCSLKTKQTLDFSALPLLSRLSE